MKDVDCRMRDARCRMQVENTQNAEQGAGCGMRDAGCGVKGNKPENSIVDFPRCLAVCSLALPSIVVFAFSASGKFALIFRSWPAKCYPQQNCCRSSSPWEI